MSWARNASDPLVLWQSDSYVMPAFTSGDQYWLVNNNTVAAGIAGPTVPLPATTSWFEIPTLGADLVRIVFATKILAGATGTGTVTSIRVDACAVGQSYMDTTIDYLSQLPITRTVYTTAFTALIGDSVALSVQGGLNDESGGIVNSLLLTPAVGASALVIPDGSAIVAGDYGWMEHRIRGRTAAVVGSGTGIILASHPSTVKLTGLVKVYYALRLSPVLSAPYTNLTFAGRLLAFRENEI